MNIAGLLTWARAGVRPAGQA